MKKQNLSIGFQAKPDSSVRKLLSFLCIDRIEDVANRLWCMPVSEDASPVMRRVCEKKPEGDRGSRNRSHIITPKGVQLLHGDCFELLKTLPDCSIDAVITDPPYGLKLMNKKWDCSVPSVEVWAECLRVLKPGGHLLAFAGTRTQHRMAVGIEDAGFEIRDMIAWVYGSGFPKSMNVSKAMSKDTSSQWLGWGTALKPALEPITVARKPFSSTVVDNVLEHGTGALNIDGCRADSCGDTSADGRWPANLIHDGGAEISSLLGNAARFFYCPKTSKTDRNEGCGALEVRTAGECTERADGSDGMNSPRAGAGRTCGNRNHHPTVKPTELMRFLCRLITQPGGMVLDPFMGSGSTGKAAVLEGFGFTGIEREIEYITIARARIEYAEKLFRSLP